MPGTRFSQVQLFPLFSSCAFGNNADTVTLMARSTEVISLRLVTELYQVLERRAHKQGLPSPGVMLQPIVAKYARRIRKEERDAKASKAGK